LLPCKTQVAAGPHLMATTEAQAVWNYNCSVKIMKRSLHLIVTL